MPRALRIVWDCAQAHGRAIPSEVTEAVLDQIVQHWHLEHENGYAPPVQDRFSGGSLAPRCIGHVIALGRAGSALVAIMDLPEAVPDDVPAGAELILGPQPRLAAVALTADATRDEA